MPGEGGVVVEGDRPSQTAIDAAEDREHRGDGFSGGFAGQSRGERHARLSLVQDEHGPRAFADDEIALPMASLAAGFDGFRPIMDRSSILEGVARGSGTTGATAFVATRQTTPQARPSGQPDR